MLIREAILDDIGECGDEDEDYLEEVDTDPSNNPGRPADAFDYLGMHPKPEAAMAHPSSGGGGGSTGSTTAGESSTDE